MAVRPQRLLFLVTLLLHVRRCAAGEEDTHSPPWEWAGVFDFPAAGHYTWSAARVGGSYADPAMKLAIVSAEVASSVGLHAVEDRLEELYENGDAATVQSGGELEVGSAYVLQFDQHTWVSNFIVHVDAPGALAFAAQHLPTEFENGFHYLKDEAGNDIEPAAEELAGSAHEDGDEPNGDKESTGANWGEVLLGSFVTCMPTFLGFAFPLLMMPAFRRKFELCVPAVSAFASGVLLAAAVFLLLPEALHLAAVGTTEEVDSIWPWGTSIMLGWFTCVLIHHAWRFIFADIEEASGEKATAGEGGSAAARVRLAIAGPVLFGDLFHNFADGLIIGTAFKNCSSSFAWSLVVVTVLHELPQEMADLVVLVTKAGIKWQWATLANFVVSLSTVVGAVITYDNAMDANWEGYILAYGAGVYLFVAMTELGPAVAELKSRDLLGSLQLLLPFVLGAVAIGLVLLDHKHCVAEQPADAVAADPHAGHGH